MKVEPIFGDTAVLGRNRPVFGGYGAAGYRGKRALDIALVLLMAPVALPLVALLWALVRLDGGPGFFAHRRIGRGGAPFACLKLRTMVPDAEARLAALLARDPAAAADWAARQKLRCDPRITRLGAALRRTSLDELPQLWNVLRGDMSLVGPRPVTREELPRYGLARGAYLARRPGITGLWQVFGRRAASYAERVELDLHYNRTASLTGDLRLLVLTFGAVLRRTGG